MSDATQAYTQARLKGETTWARLPEHEWPPRSRSLWSPRRGGLLGTALRGASERGWVRASQRAE
eukprot:10507506-Alexandrium_andersonii.AAC.1